MKKYLYPLVLFFIVILTGCQKEKEEDFIKVTSGLTYAVEAAGGTVNVNVETNTDYFVSIPDDAKNWISVIGSRATMQDVFSLSVTANSATSRTAKISLKNKSGEVLANIQISQEVQTIKITDGATYEVDPKGETIDVNLETNTEYTVSIPDEAKDWISIVESRSTRPETVSLKIEANDDALRTAKISFVDKSGTTLASIQITQDVQEVKYLKITDGATYDIDPTGEIINVNLETNTEYMVSIPDEAKDWISVVESRSTRQETITLNISANTDKQRIAKLLFIEKSGETLASIQISQDASSFITDMTKAFPDENFRKYILDNFDLNKDGVLSEEEALYVKEINVTTAKETSEKIKTIEGIQYFKNLNMLACENNLLTNLDISKNTSLQVLSCQFNYINKLDISKNTLLTALYCHGNNITDLDVSNNIALGILACDDNPLKNLDISNNTALYYLSCRNNQLTSLDVSNNIGLYELICDNNHIKSLDLSNCTSFTVLSCSNNQIISLDVSNNIALGVLACKDNPLKNLDISNNTALHHLNCCNNQLTSLDVSNNIGLQELICDNNHIKSLDLSNCTSLTALNCSNNQIISLDVSKTNLVNNNSVYTTLTCNMSTLNTLYLKNGWRLEGINTNRSTEFINQSTEIKYRD
ncbi:MAG: hypothetical protein K2H59_03905 [Muribaculaceae bacterium]|nr:hypothetical protein [Muribaculaceae bacterium]